MILIFCYLIISVFLIYREFKKGFSAYDIFYCGMIIFVLVGWLSSYFLVEKMYILEGNQELLNGILLDVTFFFIITSFFLVIQKKGRKEIIHFDFLKRNFNILINSLTLFTVLFCVIVIFSINLSKAPLVNIGNYNSSDMLYFRSLLYDTPLMNMLNVPRYIVYYMVIPLLFFLKGLRFNIPKIFLLLFLFTALLTLSKTMFILITFFYFIGRFLDSKKMSILIWYITISVTGYYLIVYFTYVMTIERSFIEIFEKLYIRLIATPISLSAIYADIFSYNDGFRSSIYYTYVFGGVFINIPIRAMQYISPISDGNAPTGIIGMAYPNLPMHLHWFYYLVFIIFVYIASYIFRFAQNQLIKITLIVLFGVLSWFLFFTDPLVALNSYGLLWIFIGTIIYLVVTKRIRY